MPDVDFLKNANHDLQSSFCRATWFKHPCRAKLSNSAHPKKTNKIPAHVVHLQCQHLGGALPVSAPFFWCEPFQQAVESWAFEEVSGSTCWWFFTSRHAGWWVQLMNEQSEWVGVCSSQVSQVESANNPKAPHLQGATDHGPCHGGNMSGALTHLQLQRSEHLKSFPTSLQISNLTSVQT